MSLNKFTSVEKGRNIALEIGCKTLEADEVVCEELNVATLPSSIYASYAPVVIQNTDVPTTMFGANFFGDTLLPENTLKEGYAFKVSFSGSLQSLSAETLTFTLLLGFGGSIQVVSVLPSPAFGNMGNQRWSLEYTVVCHKDGLLDKAYTVADFKTSLPTQLSAYSGNQFDSDVDFSTQQRINVLATWSNPSAGNVLTIQKAIIERLR